MTDEYGYNSKFRRDFNSRATDYRYLHSDLGFNLKSIRSDEDFNAADFTSALLTEYATIYGFDNEDAMARLAVAVDFLQDKPIDLLNEELKKLVDKGIVDKKHKKLREFVLSISGEAANSLKQRFPNETKNDSKLTAVKTNSHKAEYTKAIEPDYADVQDVIKYLFEVGNISPGHATALLVTLGYVRPETGMTKELKNDVLRIRADLQSRIEVYRKQKPSRREQDGLRIIEAFIARSVDSPNLQLSLDDADAMKAVGETMTKLHQLRDVRPKAPSERANKYDGMGSLIPFE